MRASVASNLGAGKPSDDVCVDKIMAPSSFRSDMSYCTSTSPLYCMTGSFLLQSFLASAYRQAGRQETLLLTG